MGGDPCHLDGKPIDLFYEVCGGKINELVVYLEVGVGYLFEEVWGGVDVDDLFDVIVGMGVDRYLDAGVSMGVDGYLDTGVCMGVDD